MMFIKDVYAQPVNLKNEYSFPASGKINSLGEALTFLVAPAFAIAATGVVIYFLIGATKMILSGGDKNAVAAARAMITHAIIGFILLMFMFIILQFVPTFLGLDYAIIQ